MGKILQPDLARKLKQLTESVFRPPEIVTLEAWTNGEVRALQVRDTVLGARDEVTLARRAVLNQKMRFLDVLYIEWAKRELSLELACHQSTV